MASSRQPNFGTSNFKLLPSLRRVQSGVPKTAGGTNARNRGTCKNLLTVRRDVLEASVLSGLKTHLMTPELAREFAAQYHRELNRLNGARVSTNSGPKNSTVSSGRSARSLRRSRTVSARPL